MATTVPVTLDTPITIKIQVQGAARKFKLPLRDLTIHVLPDRLRLLLGILPEQDVVFERFSDSVGAFVILDPKNPQVYKTLFRAAKAKLKLRMRANIITENNELPGSFPVSSLSTPPAASLAAEKEPVAQPTTQAETPSKQPQHPFSNSSPMMPVPAESILSIENLNRATLMRIHQSSEQSLALRPKATPVTLSSGPWSVYCNACDKPMPDEHYHCSICDNGDYDLCPACVEAGIHCPGEGHWLIKRFVKNGSVINSTTECISPKVKPVSIDIPEAMPAESLPVAEDHSEAKVPLEQEVEQHGIPSRTCNSCVKVFPEDDFVTCTTCDDFDLCLTCHVDARHGHHPAHAFVPANHQTALGPLAEFLCAPGRNVRHAAVCDGCDKFIHGVRHKCLTCPDFDYCSDCVKNSRFIHRDHRFVPIYDPLPEPRLSTVRHYGIYCDGPLCKAAELQSYIEGVRYKCAVCHDTDFCARCEALPQNRHNRTHPLIMFKSPVRNVNVTTVGEDKNGAAMPPMGDRPTRKPSTTEIRPTVNSVNAATQVQTIIDVKPTEEVLPSKQSKEKIEIKDLLTPPITEKIKVEHLLADPVKAPSAPSFVPTDFNAHFVRDVIPDGSKLPTGMVFSQSWTLRNSGPHDWPAGCSVRYVGGDNMLNVDDNRPSSADEIIAATESNTTLGPVKVGEEVEFVVRMKAGKREGTAISYWRLKTSDGIPFGHRLWCHINVVSDLVDVADVPECIREELVKWKAQVKVQEHNERVQEYKDRLKSLLPEQRPNVVLPPSISQQESASSQQTSQMIFPQLDKESPVSSIHNVARTSDECTETGSITKDDDLDSLDEDGIVDIGSTDDGFLTDEEYDILDASDEERS